MHTSLSLALCALLFAVAEAGPLAALDRRAEAVRKWARDGGKGGVGADDASPTVVTIVPGEALKATGVPNSQIPTAVTGIPSSTASVSPEIFAANLELAKQYNAAFSTLTRDSACIPNQAACINGDTAICGADGGFAVRPCGDAGTSCFALPLKNADGVELACVDKATAEGVLGELPPAAEPAPTSAASGEFTKTATVSQSSGALTITLTVRPDDGPAATPSASASEPESEVTTTITRTRTTTRTDAEPTAKPPIEVIPIEDPVTTTITTTILPSAAPSGGAPPAPPAGDESPSSSSSDVPSQPPQPPRTRTRTRGRPAPTSTQVPDGVAADPAPTQAPGGGAPGGGANDDTRVTFTLIETTTVTEKETVTVTVAGAAAATRLVRI